MSKLIYVDQLSKIRNFFEILKDNKITNANDIISALSTNNNSEMGAIDIFYKKNERIQNCIKAALEQTKINTNIQGIFSIFNILNRKVSIDEYYDNFDMLVGYDLTHIKLYDGQPSIMVDENIKTKREYRQVFFNEGYSSLQDAKKDLNGRDVTEYDNFNWCIRIDDDIPKRLDRCPMKIDCKALMDMGLSSTPFGTVTGYYERVQINMMHELIINGNALPLDENLLPPFEESIFYLRRIADIRSMTEGKGLCKVYKEQTK